jgi:hypothetical protein
MAARASSIPSLRASLGVRGIEATGIEIVNVTGPPWSADTSTRRVSAVLRSNPS